MIIQFIWKTLSGFPVSSDAFLNTNRGKEGKNREKEKVPVNLTERFPVNLRSFTDSVLIALITCVTGAN